MSATTEWAPWGSNPRPADYTSEQVSDVVSGHFRQHHGDEYERAIPGRVIPVRFPRHAGEPTPAVV
ncbi:hypothetical protein [Cellulomonas timonensis]|uniref:hypothetical protein n=1 Tax=Cellulomonas timonensis TaxID=1689271 RepID=UPI00082D87BA|nr:hypothetical protein [Cellulomonas timonensis]